MALSFKLPSQKEQVAISEVLQDMDREIKDLVERLKKIRLIKQDSDVYLFEILTSSDQTEAAAGDE